MSATIEPQAAPGCTHAFASGPFRLLPARLLLERGQPVRLGSRTLDLLAALIERAGEVVSNEELIAGV
jgi:DNA-binding winged helix-turn-helix (wHTH) protein